MTLSLLGVILALLLFLVSTSPSLMPRPWWAQAVMSGTLMVGGYVIGFIAEWIWRLLADLIDLDLTYNAVAGAWLRTILGVGIVVLFLVGLSANYRGAAETARLVGMRPASPASHVAALAGAFVVATGLVLAYEGLYMLWSLLVSVLPPTLPRGLAAISAWAAVAVIALLSLEWGIVRQVARRASRWASTRDRETPSGVEAPTVTERSASPASPVAWAATSREGKRYLSGPAKAERIRAVTGREAREPIRVYTSLAAHNEDVDAAVVSAIAELHRTDAFARSVVLVVVPTGSGWVDEWNVQALEYLTGGDCASVAVQYSYLPSWMTYLRYRDQAADGGRALIDAVTAELARLDPQRRPRLFVTGVSLGSYGAQSAFASPADLLSRVDGALFVGTPGFTALARSFTRARHRGSPEIAPVVANGRNVRFVTRPGDLWRDLYGRDLGPWSFPRIVYAQHASDPVVWWQPELAWREPAWIGERAGADVSPHLRWHRLVTSIQLLGDLPLAEAAPAGHGHHYSDELIPAWRAILGGDAAENEDAAIAQAIAAHPV